MDDMDLVETINGLKKDFSQLPAILVKQQNDHRIGMARLGILLSYWIQGTLDFRLTVLLGYLNLILLGWSFFLVYRSISKGYIWFLPVTLLLFSPIVQQAHLSSITAYQHTLCISFSILALYFTQATKIRVWYYVFPLSIAATLTTLDGISLPMVLLFWLATQKRWKHFFTYLIFICLLLLVYFYNFKFSPASKLPASVDGFYLVVQSFAALIGSSIAKLISDTHAVLLSIVAGSAILLIFLLLKFAPFAGYNRLVSFKENVLRFTLAEICFLRLLGSMAMISIGRAADGVDGMMAVRFQIYSVSVLIVFYLFVIEKTKGRLLSSARYSFLLLAFVLNLLSYVKYNEAVNYFSSSLKADTYNYPQKGVFLHQYFNLPDPESEFYDNYNFPVYFDEKTIDRWKDSRDTSSNSATLNVITTPHAPGNSEYLYPLIAFTIAIDKFEQYDKESFLCLTPKEGIQKPYMVALKKNNQSVYNLLKDSHIPNTFYGEIPGKLPKGTYKASLCWIKSGAPRAILLTDSLVL